MFFLNSLAIWNYRMVGFFHHRGNNYYYHHHRHIQCHHCNHHEITQHLFRHLAPQAIRSVPFHKPVAMEEKRRAWDGVPYTQEQFVQYYGDVEHGRRKFACRARRRFGASAEIQAASELVAQSTAEIEGGATEHVVFCLMASKLTHLTNEASVLFLCQNQERVAGQLYLHTITDVSACTWALNDPFFRLLRLTRYSHRQPVRTTLEMYRRDLVWHRLRKFFSIWRAATFLFPKL